MNLRESSGIALQALRANKLRSALTLLGVIVLGLKGADNTAQGKRSGARREAPPWVSVARWRSPAGATHRREWVDDGFVAPLQGCD